MSKKAKAAKAKKARAKARARKAAASGKSRRRDRLFEAGAETGEALTGAIVTETAPAPFEPEEDLLERARAQWQMGDWPALTALAEQTLENHPDRARLGLLAAVGFAQTGDMARARRYAAWALDWGCERELVARVLIGGVYNSLGRVASLQRDETRAAAFFETSVATVSPRADATVLGRARNIHEKARLGLLPEAARLAGLEAADLRRPDPARSERVLHERLERLETTLEALERPGLPGAVAPKTLPEILQMHRLQPDRRPGHRLLACCHHKSGTNFLLPVFKALARAFDLPIWLKFYDAEPDHWRICLHQHARIADISETDTFRGVHLARHPMGLIYSAMRYHGARCPEPWAHVPLQRFTARTFWAISTREGYNQIKDPQVPMARKEALMRGEDLPPPPFAEFDSGYDFGGRSYAEMMESAGSEAERLRFEMHAYSQGVLRDMLSFPSDRRFFRLGLEAVSHDSTMAALQQMVAHLGFGGASAARMLEIAAGHCLWNIERPAHATTGVSDAWRAAFDGAPERDFRRLFGWAEEALGYG